MCRVWCELWMSSTNAMMEHYATCPLSLSRLLFLYAVSGVFTNPLATSLFAPAHYCETCNFYILVCLAKNRCSHFVIIYIFFYFTFFDAKYTCEVWTPSLKALILWVLCVLMNHETESNLDNFETSTSDNDQKHMWT